MDDITFISIPTVHERTFTYNMWKNREIFFLNQIFHKGGPLWFFQFFDEVVNEKPSKMTFLKKKFQGSLQIGITYDLFFVKFKLGQKNFKFFFQFFFSNSKFSSSKNRTPKLKIEKKNSVQHLEYCFRLIYYKFGHFR